jgi:hypothetical protein
MDHQNVGANIGKYILINKKILQKVVGSASNCPNICQKLSKTGVNWESSG